MLPLFLVTVLTGWMASTAVLSDSVRSFVAPIDTVYTVIITGGNIYDGLGGAPKVNDIGILGDRIVRIGDLSRASASRRVDAAGLAVTPGFIDIHSHATSSTIAESGIVQRPLAENYVREGVTTALGGQDGSSPVAIGDALSELSETPAAINIGLFVGHGSIRSFVMGEDDRPPTNEELARMTELVREAMEEGAFGLSSGLEYTPGSFADTRELITMARPLAPYGGLYISHIRDEGGKLLESVREVIQIGEEAGVAAQVTHHKVVGKGRWGLSRESLQLIDDARTRGVDVMSDQYPYTASSTGLTILLPKWSKNGGKEALLRRLKDPAIRARIHSDVVDHINQERGGDPSTIVAARCPDRSDADGKSLAELLEEKNRPVTVEGAADVALDLIEGGGCSGVFHSMSEEDVHRIMQHPFTMIASDGGIPDPKSGVPHPRNYGTFARVLGRYVREQHILPFPDAIRKMTSLPAGRLGLRDRGRLMEGAMADITILDPAVVIDQAKFGDPHHYGTGVIHVFVAGVPVLLNGNTTGNTPGKVLQHTH